MPDNRIVYESKYSAGMYAALGLDFRNSRTSVTPEEHEKLRSHPLYGVEFAKVGELKYRPGANVPRVRVQRNDRGQNEAVTEQVRAYEHPVAKNKLTQENVSPKDVERVERDLQERERKAVVKSQLPDYKPDSESDIDKMFT